MHQGNLHPHQALHATSQPTHTTEVMGLRILLCIPRCIIDSCDNFPSLSEQRIEIQIFTDAAKDFQVPHALFRAGENKKLSDQCHYLICKCTFQSLDSGTVHTWNEMSLNLNFSRRYSVKVLHIRFHYSQLFYVQVTLSACILLT